MEQLLVREGLINVLSSTQPLRTLNLFNNFESDLVTLDLHMPEFDWFAVLAQLNRRIPHAEYLTILILAADATPPACTPRPWAPRTSSANDCMLWKACYGYGTCWKPAECTKPCEP
jgi:CheY-like chemotaxis protein